MPIDIHDSLSPAAWRSENVNTHVLKRTNFLYVCPLLDDVQ